MATASHDWTGSSSQRKNAEPCRYPGAKPTPKPKEFFVPAGTPALYKKVGDTRWLEYTTTQDLAFDSKHGESATTITFFRTGYLLCVRRDKIQEREQQESTQ
jgi:hypothetical protein